jgi:hypothetical protein
MKSPTPKKTRSRDTKPIGKVPQLDILALGERISHLEKVVGKLFYVIKEGIVQAPDQKHARSVLSNLLKDESIQLDKNLKLI